MPQDGQYDQNMQQV